MKNSVLAMLLIVLLLLAAIAAAVLSFQYVRLVSEMRTLQGQVDGVNRTKQVIQSLAGEALEYSKTHPAIDPILQQFGVKQKPAAPAPAPAAAPKPGSPKKSP